LLAVASNSSVAAYVATTFDYAGAGAAASTGNAATPCASAVLVDAHIPLAATAQAALLIGSCNVGE